MGFSHLFLAGAPATGGSKSPILVILFIVLFIGAAITVAFRWFRQRQ